MTWHPISAVIPAATARQPIMRATTKPISFPTAR